MFIITSENTDSVYYVVHYDTCGSLSLYFRVFRKSGEIEEAKICTFYRGYVSGFNNYIKTIGLGQVDIEYRNLDILPSSKYMIGTDILFYRFDIESRKFSETSKENYTVFFTKFEKGHSDEKTN